MRRLGHTLDEQTISFVSFAVATLKAACLQQRFHIIQNQQTALFLQQFNQQGNASLLTLR